MDCQVDFFTNSDSRDDISPIARCQSWNGEREKGQIVLRTEAWRQIGFPDGAGEA